MRVRLFVIRFPFFGVGLIREYGMLPDFQTRLANGKVGDCYKAPTTFPPKYLFLLLSS